MKRSTLRDLMIEKKDMLRVLYLQEEKSPMVSIKWYAGF